MRVDLHDGWTLHLTGDEVPAQIPDQVPATVPGVVHTDLLEAGLIPDPYLGTAEDDVQWVAHADARYTTRFDLADAERLLGHDRVDLAADGLDTVATVRLNGVVVGQTRNQHRSYRFDVREVLRPEGNELEVVFDAPLRAARESEARIGAKPLVDDALPYNALRKMACNFGWDWGPTLTTAGIWRPIGLHAWSTARLAGVVPQVTVDDDGCGHVEVRADVERAGEADVTLDVTVTAPDGSSWSATGDDAGALTVDVPAAQLWWPRGYGEQPLYRVEVRLSSGGRELDSWTRSVGFRTVEVRMEPDEVGTTFEFHVNGQLVWIKGANWIPDDCFPSRVTDADYARGVRDAVEADMNMLRIWGGGLYESDVLYDLCDREGLLVWQDFLFACAMYSEADELWQEVEAEARQNVARLAPHPSLVIWNGSNENIEGFYHWGFAERMTADEAWGAGYYDELLPRVLAEVDPARAGAYIPSSPYNPVERGAPRDPDHGPVHSWKVWFSEDYLTYRDAIPRFVAEFGFQAPAAWSTLVPAVQDADPSPRTPGMLGHQKAGDGNGKLERGWAPHLPEPTTFDDWYVTTQLNQARAISCAVAHYRSHAPRNAGYLVWQLNDCWPAISWATVDNAGRRKPLWFALRALNAPRVVLLQPRDGAPALVVSNDSPQRWVDTVTVRRLAMDGTERGRTQVPVDVAPRATATITLPAEVADAEDARAEVLVADSADPQVAPSWWYFVEDVDLELPNPQLTASVERTPTGYDVTVEAGTFVKDLMLFPDRLDADATVDDPRVTLLAGQSHTFVVRSAAELDPARLVAVPVLHSASHLVAAGRSLVA